MINDKIAAGIEKVTVRSVIGCRTKHGVCAKCYGMGLATRHPAAGCGRRTPPPPRRAGRPGAA